MVILQNEWNLSIQTLKIKNKTEHHLANEWQKKQTPQPSTPLVPHCVKKAPLIL